MVDDILSHGKCNLIVTVVFIRVIKLNISLVFISQPCFVLSKNVKLSSTQRFTTKIANKRQLAFNSI